MNNHTVVVGNALAGMVAALELAEQGKQVTLVNPGGPLGGYFAGLQIDGVMFDAGLVKFELDGYLNQAKWSELASYDPTLRNDVGRFLNIVHEWALKYSPLHQFDMPKMMVHGAVYDDVILSNAYHSFSQLPFAQNCIAELQQSQPEPSIHARQKVNGTAYDTLDYATASIANHGKTMHENIIAPYLLKAQGVTADRMLARYHRVAWLPLFYPETLLESYQGKPVSLAPTKFHYPKLSSVGAIVTKVKQELLAHKNIHYVTQAVQQVTKSEEGWQVRCAETVLDATDLVWTYQPSQLLKCLGLQPTAVQETKSAIAVSFFRIKKADIRNVYTLLNVVDLNCSLYRITNQTACAEDHGDFMNIAAEFNTDYFRKLYGDATDDAFIIEKLLAELAQMQLIAEDTVPVIAAIKRIPGGFLVPDAAARDAWEQDQRTIIQHYPEIALLAMSSGFFATSLNDQVVQGLHYAATKAHIFPVDFAEKSFTVNA
ncbi:MAG: FAD-binding protein [Methylophilus sp.]|nr:FAD-binding protein [Methylophilus sp.]